MNAMLAARQEAPQTHHLRSIPETVHWGYLDPTLKPVLTINSGDTVVIDTVSGNPPMMPAKDSGYNILPEHLEIHQKVKQGSGNHIFTGPVYVEDAEPGDVLEVRIQEIALRQNWGWNSFRGLVGTLPEDFPYQRIIQLAIDREAMTATMPWGMKIPIRPFFGQLAVAPRPEYGRQNSKEPREFGGNLDCKELIAGSTIYLPVWTKGALFSTGDGHAVQGDGEVCGTAIETALTGTFQFIVRKDLAWRMPRAESPTHFITLGLDVDLDDAAAQALRAMIDWLTEKLGIAKADAYSLASFAVDLHVTQTVNNVKGVHAMIDKSLLQQG
ncbi:MAG TPA: acetamidase/formamidase family protein [Pseudolabrys sp.]|nr:acetamidase/formamidase family protein [Pseudolabrys sp.]